jgi:hypothetical protein
MATHPAAAKRAPRTSPTCTRFRVMAGIIDGWGRGSNGVVASTERHGRIFLIGPSQECRDRNNEGQVMNVPPRAVGELLSGTPVSGTRPRWPTVVGVISMVLGAPASISLVLGLAWLVTGGGPLMGIAKLRGMTLAGNIVLGVYVFGASLLLFLGGGGLVRRCSWGRTLLLVYAWGTLVLLAAYLGMWFLSFVTGGYRDCTNFAGMAWVGIRPWLPHGVYPLFLVIWFLRPGIKRQVAGW